MSVADVPRSTVYAACLHALLHQARNRLEAWTYEMRATLSRAHAQLLDSALVNRVLDEVRLVAVSH